MPRLQSKDITYSVHQIGLARAVRPDDRREVLAFPKIDGVRPSKRFEALYFQFDDAAARLLDVHVGHARLALSRAVVLSTAASAGSAGVAWLALCAAMRLCCDSRLRGSLSSWRHAGALRAHSLLYRSTAADQQRSWVVRRIYVAMRPS